MERFYSKVSKLDSGCHLWTGVIEKHGYGRFRIGNRMVLAHRVAFELTKGEIPHGLVIDHLCRNKWCVNPNHLESVSPRINTLRGVGLAASFARREKCECGRKFGKSIFRNGHNFRLCKVCVNRRAREAYARRSAVAA